MELDIITGKYNCLQGLFIVDAPYVADTLYRVQSTSGKTHPRLKRRLRFLTVSQRLTCRSDGYNDNDI